VWWSDAHRDGDTDPESPFSGAFGVFTERTPRPLLRWSGVVSVAFSVRVIASCGVGGMEQSRKESHPAAELTRAFPPSYCNALVSEGFWP
jgi:hypothetical protein